MKFRLNDLVEVTYLPTCMSHFTKGKAVIIEEDEGDYGLLFENGQKRWWYHSENLTLIKRNHWQRTFK